MKTCPSCYQTYSDETMMFCLADGARLLQETRAIDPNAAWRLQPPESTNPGRTVVGPRPTVANPQASPGKPQSTITYRPELIQVCAQPFCAPSASSELSRRRVLPWVFATVLVIGISSVLIVQVVRHSVSPVSNTSTSRGPTVGGSIPLNSTNPCFADPGAGSTNRDAHYSWVQRQNAATLKDNLNTKAAVLFRCRSMNVDQLSSAFANISVIVATYVPSANCFGGDRGVVNTNRSEHRSWGASKGAEVMLNNLQWKMAAALKCMNRSQQNSFFADVSVAMARASSQ